MSPPSPGPATSPRAGSERLLVPVGPLAARVCSYANGSASSELLDPARTATLAGDLDEPLIDQSPLPIVVRSPAPPPPACAASASASPAIVAVFAYRDGPAVTVAVGPPACRFATNGTLTTTATAGVVNRLTGR